MNTHQIFSLIIILITLIGVAIGRYPGLRMNRATIVLVGSTILILAQSITLNEAFNSIDLNTITLLFSMMIINANLRVCGFFDLISTKIIKYAKTPRQLLFIIIFSSGILSAIFLNDTIVLVFTPLILEITISLGLNSIPFLIALATAANVGSAATIIGNPQNMLIGISSGIPFADFLFLLAPVSISCLFIVFLIIVIIYRKEFPKKDLIEKSNKEIKIYKPLFYKSIFASLIMAILLFSGLEIPLAALTSSSILLITRRLKPQRVFREIDWSLLVFFSGLFVVTSAIETTNIGDKLFTKLIPFLEDGIIEFAISSAVISNLVSNVPAVLLFKHIISGLSDPKLFWLVLSISTTFAGNLTLLGSVANLIVAETAKTKGVHLSFVEYLKAGIPITILTLVISSIYFILFF